MIQTRVARSIHFAHAPDAEGALDRVWTQQTTRFQRHERQECIPVGRQSRPARFRGARKAFQPLKVW